MVEEIFGYGVRYPEGTHKHSKPRIHLVGTGTGVEVNFEIIIAEASETRNPFHPFNQAVLYTEREEFFPFPLTRKKGFSRVTFNLPLKVQ